MKKVKGMDIEQLYKRLGYQFKEKDLLFCALTHRSVGKNNNERLEFLGDAVLDLVVSAYLYRIFKAIKEGQLSRLRASLVRRETLAEIAKELHLGEYVKLGLGERRSGGHHRDSILANAFEAIIGAMYLDSDYQTCEHYILIWFKHRLENLSADINPTDPKSALQEFLQSRKVGLPEYHIESVSGEDHAQIFEVSCSITELNLRTVGEDHSRRKAEQAAAEKILDILQVKTV